MSVPAKGTPSTSPSSRTDPIDLSKFGVKWPEGMRTSPKGPARVPAWTQGSDTVFGMILWPTIILTGPSGSYMDDARNPDDGFR